MKCDWTLVLKNNIIDVMYENAQDKWWGIKEHFTFKWYKKKSVQYTYICDNMLTAKSRMEDK